jgi:hypothetical protein
MMAGVEIFLLVSVTLNALLIGGILASYRRRQVRKLDRLPIAKVTAEEADPMFRTGDLGPSRKTEIRFVPEYRVWGGISDLETWILCNLARNAEQVFEFGTCTGKTTWLLAANAPQATVTTLTLRPEDVAAVQNTEYDDRRAMETAISESQFRSFYYQGTPEEKRIVQVFGDSKRFDETQFVGRCDLVFVDGSHARSYVENDSKKALRMVKPGGAVVWHDYRGPQRERDVFLALNELAREFPLVRIQGTCFVFYRKPRL